jgi:hypothetical protein
VQAIDNQTVYDATIQAYGGLDDLGLILSVFDRNFDINDNIPFGTVLPLADTQDALGKRFRASETKIATGVPALPWEGGNLLQEQGDVVLQEQSDNILQE